MHVDGHESEKKARSSVHHVLTPPKEDSHGRDAKKSVHPVALASPGPAH